MRAPSQHPSRARGAAPAGCHGRVLVVEDEQDVAELIHHTLTREGYDVVVTSNGADALTSARETRPAVILLDLMVPQLNGWEICRRVKQDPDRISAQSEGIPVPGMIPDDDLNSWERLQVHL